MGRFFHIHVAKGGDISYNIVDGKIYGGITMLFGKKNKEEIKQVDKAEEKKVLSEEEGLLLDDDALEKVSGGMCVKDEDPLTLK